MESINITTAGAKPDAKETPQKGPIANSENRRVGVESKHHKDVPEGIDIAPIEKIFPEESEKRNECIAALATMMQKMNEPSVGLSYLDEDGLQHVRELTSEYAVLMKPVDFTKPADEQGRSPQQQMEMKASEKSKLERKLRVLMG